jgi:protocatechuate 3,4-dioxygenase beta subunit
LSSRSPRPNRRQMLEVCISRGFLTAAGTALALTSQNRLLAAFEAAEEQANLKPTAAEVLGPFFRKGAPNQKVLRAAGDPGFPLKVTGRVLNTSGKVVEGAKVDLWHADHGGRYDTRGYRYRAQVTPDAKGEYGVDTVMPGHYPDRPAQHIHYLIAAPGHKSLITQAYFATDPYFDGNPEKNWKKGGIAGNKELVLPVRLFEGGTGPNQPGAHAEITFDIILEKA